jgi:hypothetical protein
MLLFEDCRRFCEDKNVFTYAGLSFVWIGKTSSCKLNYFSFPVAILIYFTSLDKITARRLDSKLSRLYFKVFCCSICSSIVPLPSDSITSSVIVNPGGLTSTSYPMMGGLKEPLIFLVIISLIIGLFSRLLIACCLALRII